MSWTEPKGALRRFCGGLAPPWGPDLFVRSHEVIIGAPGCGKTPRAADRVRRARRVVFFDAAGDWHRNGEGECVPVEELTPERLRGFALRVCVEPDPDRLAWSFVRTLDACRDVYRADDPAASGLVLVVDEVGDLARPCVEELNALHRAGHKHGVASVLVSACITDIPYRCRSTASRVECFYQKSADDVSTLDREYGEVTVRGRPVLFGAAARGWRHPAPPVVWSSPVLHNNHAPGVAARAAEA